MNNKHDRQIKKEEEAYCNIDQIISKLCVLNAEKWKSIYHVSPGSTKK